MSIQRDKALDFETTQEVYEQLAASLHSAAMGLVSVNAEMMQRLMRKAPLTTEQLHSLRDLAFDCEIHRDFANGNQAFNGSNKGIILQAHFELHQDIALQRPNQRGGTSLPELPRKADFSGELCTSYTELIGELLDTVNGNMRADGDKIKVAFAKGGFHKYQYEALRQLCLTCQLHQELEGATSLKGTSYFSIALQAHFNIRRIDQRQNITPGYNSGVSLPTLPTKQ